MEMQDKEFDQLFNSKLKDFEVEPAPMVWDNIAAELDGKKESKRSLVPYLGVAASVIVLVAASVLFFNLNIKKDDDKPLKLVRHPKSVKPSFKNEGNEPVLVAQGLNHIIAETPASENKLVLNNTDGKEKIVKVAAVNTNASEIAPAEPILFTAKIETAPVLNTVAPINDIDLATAPLVNQPKPITEAPKE